MLAAVPTAPRPLRGYTETGGVRRGFEALIHRNDADAVLLELEPVDLVEAAALARDLPHRLPGAVARLGAARTLDALAGEAVAIYRELCGYDRVMFYRFDPDGHGEVAAEAKEDRLEPYLGLHYPESDIPQRARELYLRNRVRVLVDVNYEPVPLVPRLFPPTGEELDMSMSWLRSMSPLHLQYLKNMGVTATLVVSLVREGRLWGLIACHHYSPKRLPYAMRAACDLVAEILSTRIAVLENFSQVRTTALIRRMEARLMEATWTLGAWQRALLEEQRDLMRMVGRDRRGPRVRRRTRHDGRRAVHRRAARARRLGGPPAVRGRRVRDGVARARPVRNSSRSRRRPAACSRSSCRGPTASICSGCAASRSARCAGPAIRTSR